MTRNRLNQKPRPAGAIAPGRAVFDPGRDSARAVPRCYVYFDKDLTPSGLWEPNWFVRINSRAQVLSNATARVDRVQIDTQVGDFNPGPDVVSYFATTPDLRDVDLLFVEQFIGFPITRT